MESVKSDTIGGYNQFLKAQKKVEGEAVITLVQFDAQDSFEVIYRAAPVKTAAPLNDKTFVPRAGTPLLDAIGRAIGDTAARIVSDWKVIFVVITDGLENSSREFTRRKVFDLITEKRSKGWEFVFLGANQDAIREAANLGMAADSALSYASTAAGVRSAYASASEHTAALRSGRASGITFTEADRKRQERAKNS